MQFFKYFIGLRGFEISWRLGNESGVPCNYKYYFDGITVVDFPTRF